MPAPADVPQDLFDEPGLAILDGFALPFASACLACVESVAASAPFRHMTTRGGKAMSVAMTNCGPAGWVSDRRGYRYAADDPATGRPWPPLPDSFRILAGRAAAAAGYTGFDPDACLLNRYEAGARMALHQDRDEADFAQPIVSVSLGLPATFLWGGDSRAGRPRRFPLRHGDAVVWGGPARLAFHGVAPLAAGDHPATGACRYNLTFRRAL